MRKVETVEGPAGRRAAIASALERMAPRLPDFEAESAVDRALSSPGLRGAVPETAAWLALVAYARHVFTEYDALLDDGYDRDSARHFVLDDLNAVLAEWGCRRRVSEEAGEKADGGAQALSGNVLIPGAGRIRRAPPRG